MNLASNVARRDVFNRKGRSAFVPCVFDEYSKFSDKLTQQFCSWYSYDEAPLYAFLEEHNWSIRGYHSLRPDLHFDFVPFDFDSDDVLTSFAHTLKFVKWLETQGVPESHFTVWLSGSKGFHVEVDRAAFDVSHPSKDILRRLKFFVELLMKTLDIKVDLSLYSHARLYRCPNSKHAKTGLFKTLIKLDDLNVDHVSKRAEWAAWPHDDYNCFSHEELAELLKLPDLEDVQQETRMHEDLVVDSSLSIISKCPKIQQIMQNPDSRELRRQAAGVLMEAYGSSDAAEVNILYEAFRNHPYLDDVRYDDAEKWRREFDKEGLIKCQKSCTSFGCGAEQKKLCGTRAPSDHLISSQEITPITVGEARKILDERMTEAVYGENDDMLAFDMPIGIGKTTVVLRKLAEDEKLSALYLCPTHELAEQVHNKALDMWIENSRRLMSRVALDKHDPAAFVCPYIDEVRAAQGVVKSLTRTICFRCPRFPFHRDAEPLESPCEYYMQYDKLEDVRLVIATHSHANDYTYEQCKLHNRSFMVVDESPIKTFSGSIDRVADELQVIMKAHRGDVYQELIAEVNAQSMDPPVYDDTRDLEAKFDFVRHQHKVEENRLTAEKYEHDKEKLEDAKIMQRAGYTFISSVIGGLALDFRDLRHMDDRHQATLYKTFIDRIIDKSKYPPAMALQDGFRHVIFPDVMQNAIVCSTKNLQYYMNLSYYFPDRMPAKKVIVLDATSNKLLYERLIEATTEESEELRQLHYFKLPFVEQTNVHITQVTNSGYNKTRILDDSSLFDNLAYVMRNLRSTHPEAKILLVCVKDLVDKLSEGIDVDVVNYGATKGLDDYGDYDFEVVLGGFFVANGGIIENLHRLGLYDVDVELLEAATVIVRNKHVARDGGFYFSQRKAFKYSKPRETLAYANALFGQTAASEVVQAVRLRLFSGATDKTCIILTNVGLTTIYADRFMSLQELSAELEDTSGIQSDIDTTIVRRNNLMLAKLHRVEVGDEFCLSDINADEAAARRFLVQHQNIGTLKRTKPKTYMKVTEVGQQGELQAKSSKSTVSAKLDSWLDSLSGMSEFTSSEAAEAADTVSAHFIKDWLRKNSEAGSIVKMGDTKNTKYRKLERLTGMLSKLLR